MLLNSYQQISDHALFVDLATNRLVEGGVRTSATGQIREMMFTGVGICISIILIFKEDVFHEHNQDKTKPLHDFEP